MELAVVVVTHNSSDVLPGLLASIPAQTDDHRLELIVVDSGSTDGSVDLVRRLRPSATVVELGGNRGYAAGVNAGWAVAGSAEAMVLLNPDLELRPETLDVWTAGLGDPAADGVRSVGIVAPLIVDDRGERQHSLRRRPGPLTAWAEALLGGTVAGRLGIGELVVDEAAYVRRTECDWASGAAMAISRDCLAAVGPWEERYFLYAEEIDFCLRAGAAGFVTRLEPQVVVEHRGGEMSVAAPLFALMTWNRVRLQRKLRGPIAARLVAAGAVFNEAIRWMAGSRRGVRSAALRVLLRPGDRSGILPPSTDLEWTGAS